MTTGVVGVVWFGKGLGPAAARLALRPLSAAFGVIVRARSALYDAGALRSSAPAIPVLSVGNLTVGGTGKTPVSAWLAARLSGSARTAVALRGYGGDEIAVHARLNPHVPVLAGADRLAAVAQAKARGAEIVVLDDGFQHRRLRATATVVLTFWFMRSGWRVSRLEGATLVTIASARWVADMTGWTWRDLDEIDRILRNVSGG